MWPLAKKKAAGSAALSGCESGGLGLGKGQPAGKGLWSHLQGLGKVILAEFKQLPAFRVVQELLYQLMIDVMTRFEGTNMAKNRVTDQAQIAYCIEDLVTNEFILETQTLGV